MYPLSKPSFPYSDRAVSADRYVRRTIAIEQPRSESAQYELLEDFMVNERPYLRQGYTLIHMSRDLGIPRHILSRMINRKYGMNFNAIINKFRIEYLKDIPSREPNWNLYTMEALGKLAGFNSRNTLIKAFRKCEGESPSSYFMRVGRHGLTFVLGTNERMN